MISINLAIAIDPKKKVERNFYLIAEKACNIERKRCPITLSMLPPSRKKKKVRKNNV